MVVNGFNNMNVSATIISAFFYIFLLLDIRVNSVVVVVGRPDQSLITITNITDLPFSEIRMNFSGRVSLFHARLVFLFCFAILDVSYIDCAT